jgi:hypothetical protein
VNASWRGQQWELPPLILHPFNHSGDAAKLLQSSKLSLYLSGLVADEPDEDVEAALLEGRYCEFQMVCYIGKDLTRWIGQCAEFVRRDQSLAGSGIVEQSFSDMLLNRAPPEVANRFQSWGVVQYRRILSRAIGLNALFPHPPPYEVLSRGFLIHYYSYADHLYTCYQGLEPFTRIDPEQFRFSLFTSEEYAQKIEHTSQGE